MSYFSRILGICAVPADDSGGRCPDVRNCRASPHVLALPNRPNIDSGSDSDGRWILTGTALIPIARATAIRVLSIVTIPSAVSMASTAGPFQPVRIDFRSCSARPRPPAVRCEKRISFGSIRANRPANPIGGAAASNRGSRKRTRSQCPLPPCGIQWYSNPVYLPPGFCGRITDPTGRLCLPRDRSDE